MSEQLSSQTVNESEAQDEKKKQMPLPDSIFKAEIEGNLRFPQSAGAIVFFVGNVLLSESHPNFSDFYNSEFSVKQMEQIKLYMNRAHVTREIPVGSPESLATREGLPEDPEHVIEVADQRLQALWQEVREAVVLAIAEIISQLEPNLAVEPDIESEEATKHLVKIFADETNRDLTSRLRNIFRSGVEALRSEEMKPVLTEYRDSYTKKPIYIAMSTEEKGVVHVSRQELKEQVRDFILDSIRKVEPIFTDEGTNTLQYLFK